MGFGTNTWIKRVKDSVLLNNYCVCRKPGASSVLVPHRALDLRAQDDVLVGRKRYGFGYLLSHLRSGLLRKSCVSYESVEQLPLDSNNNFTALEWCYCGLMFILLFILLLLLLYNKLDDMQRKRFTWLIQKVLWFGLVRNSGCICIC